ncbi:DUF4435 domain-containing protein [Acetobacter persici]|uniref:DUF4435 domain-containing protein n=1 Tax=Acetobacter persici TaxID=1076596 RepID=UPI001BAA4C02|nr:DUF4435 domain-containing protein [Acetobacter persici]MBS0964222.1 DUF4435 domain-containing protein [Acetobacter persici]
MTIIDDYAQYLLEEANSSIAALHQFKLLYNPNQEEYHFFFEGEEDGLFYMPEARRYVGDKNYYIYDCGGKKNVIEVRDSAKEELYDINKCLFFVDRDYDDILGIQVEIDEHTYITDHYSIENDLSNVCGARILMSDIIRISKADPEFSRIENTISTGLLKFYRKILPLSAWIIAAKQEGCAPNLRNTTGLKGIVTLSGLDPKLTKSGFVEFKKRVISNEKRPSISSVLKWARILDINSAKKWVRGKYDIWFFQVLLLSALNEANSRRRSAGGRIIRIPGAVREGRFFEVLGGRMPVPDSLRAFYRRKLL